MMTRFELTTVLEDARVNGLTHSLFPYPARTTPSIPREAIAKLSPPGGIVLDPFCGGGTTLVEALGQGRRAVGNDLNPIAVYVSKVKTSRLDPHKFDNAFSYVLAGLNGDIPSQVDGSDLFDERELTILPRSVVSGVYGLSSLIDNLSFSSDVTRLLRLVLGATCFTLQERRMLDRIATGKVSFEALYAGRLREASKSVHAFHSQVSGVYTSQVLNQDAAALSEFIPSVIPRADLAVMSPPYIDVHVEYAEIMIGGRVRSMLVPKLLNIPMERKNYVISERQYFEKLGDIASMLTQVVKKGAYVCVIVGFKNSDYDKRFNSVFRSNGLRLVSRWVRPVKATYHTRRMFHSFLSKKSVMMRREYVLFYRT